MLIVDNKLLANSYTVVLVGVLLVGVLFGLLQPGSKKTAVLMIKWRLYILIKLIKKSWFIDIIYKIRGAYFRNVN